MENNELYVFYQFKNNHTIEFSNSFGVVGKFDFNDKPFFEGNVEESAQIFVDAVIFKVVSKLTTAQQRIEEQDVQIDFLRGQLDLNKADIEALQSKLAVAVDGIESALRIKELWLPPSSDAEHFGEFKALHSMHNKFLSIIKQLSSL